MAENEAIYFLFIDITTCVVPGPEIMLETDWFASTSVNVKPACEVAVKHFPRQ